MLILSRQTNETIMIGDDIEITVVEVKGSKVRLGINAPKMIPIHRKEIYLKIKEQNIESSRVGIMEVDLGTSLLSQFAPAIIP
ncbi:MAG: carbon storage regulator CsrA [Desulfobacterales bacterium]|nr:carbon storage regulator CsrA [Desulfobacterales bacterium]